MVSQGRRGELSWLASGRSAIWDTIGGCAINKWGPPFGTFGIIRRYLSDGTLDAPILT